MPNDARTEAPAAPPLDVTPLDVTLLGTGTSTGVPVIGCGCRVCQSTDPHDARTRCACYVEAGSGPGEPVRLLIDTGPDFRQQALRFHLRRLDAILFTHAHFDHVVGVDDLRPFFFGNDTPMPCFARPNAAAVLRRMFPHIFVHDDYAAAPNLELHETGAAPFCARSRYDDAAPPVRVEPLALLHGELPVSGYRIGRFAYLTDASRIPEETFDALAGAVDVLVLDALRPRPHPTHLSIDEAVAAARRIGARQTYFIHITHDVLHAEADARLPDGINLGYDGLRFAV